MFIWLAPALNLTAATTNSMEDLPEDLRISFWDETFALRSGAGYKDNVLLSDADKTGSGFVQNGLDVAILRLPITDPWELRLFLTGDDRRYWRGDMGVDHQDWWSGIAEARREFADGWSFEGSVTYDYIYDVVDLHDFLNLADQQPPLNVEGHTVIVRPGIERTLWENWSLKLEAEGTRAFLSEPADSYFRFGPILTLAYDYAPSSEVSLSYSALDYYYDHETDLDAEGGDTIGGSLRILKDGLTLASKHYWDKARHWETTAKLAFAYYQDNGSGYYNYYDYNASAGFSYHNNAWDISASGGVEYLDSPIQTVQTLSGPGPRFRQTLLSANARIARQIIKLLKVFVEYENDTSLSNSQDDVWHANTVNGGLELEF